jgi:ParB family chromosome partitioning protein
MAEQNIRKLDVAAISPNPENPRKDFPAEHIATLAASIRERGLMQPIIVRPGPKVVGQKSRYILVAGECRLRAHQHLGWELIDAIVRTGVDERESLLQAIVENMARRDVRPLDEARAFKRAIDAGLTELELAKAIGFKSQPWRIGYRIRLLRLDPQYQRLLDSGDLSLNAAQEIAKLEVRDQGRVIRQLAAGTLKGDIAVAAAVKAIQDELSQEDIFGAGGRAVAAQDLETVGRMEAKIEQVAKMVSAGWHANECTIARKVSPDRTALMADKLAAIRGALAKMEKELRTAAAQAALTLEAA